MLKCDVCRRNRKYLRFKTSDLKICMECVDFLNTSPSVSLALSHLKSLFKKGVLKRLEDDLLSDEDFVVDAAKYDIENIDSYCERHFEKWLKRKLKSDKTWGKEFFLVRAWSKGLVYRDFSKKRDRPANFDVIGRKIRSRDDNTCMLCGCLDSRLDAHHIVYASNLGTHRKINLIALCRPCHEGVHGRSFEDSTNDSCSVMRSTADYVGEKTIVACHSCEQKLRIPSLQGIKVKCVTCGFVFFALNDK